MKNKITKLGMIVIFILTTISSSIAFSGNDSSGNTIRFATGYITMNSTGSTENIHSFGDSISRIITDDNFKGWLSQLDYNFFAPAQVNLHLPLNNTYFNYTPQFDWSNTTDIEQFAISYIFEAWNDSATTNINFVNNTITETANTTSTTPTINGEGAFYWRIIANDSSKNSTASELRIINIDLTLPTAFNLTSPADGTSSTDTTPTLEWDSSIDTNLDNYTIEISGLADFSVINQTEVIETNSLSNWSSPLTTATTYYWRVSAVDKANNQRLSDNNLSFTVTASETVTVTVPIGESSAGGGTKPFTLNILAPEGVTIYKDDTVIIPLLIINPSGVAFRGINLKLDSTEPGISLALDRNYIPEISPRGQEKLQLTITTKDLSTGTYGLTIGASIVSPTFSDIFRIFANLIEKDSAAKEDVSDRIEFAKQLFNGNPECLDLSEYISEAETALQNDQRDKALSLAENAAEACNKLIEQRGSFEPLTTQAVFLDKIKIQLESQTFIIIASQVLALIILIVTILYFKKRKKSKHKQKKNSF